MLTTTCIVQNSVSLSEVDSDNCGKVMLFHAGVWGAVTGDSFDDESAAIVCRQMGLTGGKGLKKYTWTWERRDRIWMDDVHCAGTEASLAECAFNGWGKWVHASWDMFQARPETVSLAYACCNQVTVCVLPFV